VCGWGVGCGWVCGVGGGTSSTTTPVCSPQWTWAHRTCGCAASWMIDKLLKMARQRKDAVCWWGVLTSAWLSCTVQGLKSSQVDSKFHKLRLTDASFPGEFSLRSARLSRNECKNPLVGFQNCLWTHERRCCAAGSTLLQLKVSSLKIAPATKYIISSPFTAPCVPCSRHRNQGDTQSCTLYTLKARTENQGLGRHTS
jgi:hypothetical protein